MAAQSSPRDQQSHTRNGGINSKLILSGLALMTLFIASLNFWQYNNQTSPLPNPMDSDESRRIKLLERKLNEALTEIQSLKSRDMNIALPQQEKQSIDTPQSQNNTLPEYQIKASSINSYWWPSLHSGLLGKLNAAQNPSDCSAETTKYFVWRSRSNNQNDTRGLTAWGHAAKSHLIHGELMMLYCVIKFETLY
jgi:hypothetical protein